MAATPKRVVHTLFCRYMLGPSFGHVAASITALVLVEKLAMELALPWIPMLESCQAALGRTCFVLVGGTITGILGYWAIGGLFALPACLHVEKWKIQANKNMDIEALLRAMPLVIFNFTTAIVVYGLLVVSFLPDRSFDLTALPSVGTMARDSAVTLGLQEVSFFYSHRWLHVNKNMYAAVHKLHHTWTVPVSLVAIYCHPFENIVANILPLLVGPLLCRSHLAFISIYLFVGLVHTTAVHSGYWIGDDKGMHDEHHRSFNVNYGTMGFMDHWYGTYQLPAGATGVALAKGSLRKS